MDSKRDRQRATYFTELEQEVLVSAYKEYKFIFDKKGNTAKAAKERQVAWEKIADRVNACNPGAPKRTWQQIKVKYKNIVQTANRKRAEARRTVGGPPPCRVLSAEEEMLCENTAKPIVESIPGGISSEATACQDTTTYIKVKDTLELLDIKLQNDEDDYDGETVSSVPTDSLAQDTARESSPCPPQQENPQRLHALPVQDLYKIHLEKQIRKCDLQMDQIKLQMDHSRLLMEKTKLEIGVLQHQLKGMKQKEEES